MGSSDLCSWRGGSWESVSYSRGAGASLLQQKMKVEAGHQWPEDSWPQERLHPGICGLDREAEVCREIPSQLECVKSSRVDLPWQGAEIFQFHRAERWERMEQGMESWAVPSTGFQYRQHFGCWRFPTQLKFGRVELPTQPAQLLQSSRKAEDAQGKEMDK